MNKNREQSLNRHELLKQSLRQNPPDPNRIFDLFLNKSELEINLENVITVLRDSYDKNQYFEKRSQLLVKFLDKALRILSTTEQWLDEIDRLINEYEKSSINLPASLYYAKFRCLATLSVSDAKAESFIEKAIDLEINIYNQLDYQLELAMYYENTSQYRKMKKIIDQCEILCRQYSNLDQQLARTLLYLGHYYFYTFQLDKAANYMNQAQNILET
ncbi:hypothetical protein M595_6444, partial [Lyngbya aestuarii BL J]